MSKQEHMGQCQICGKYGKLTFEHIPPQKAFNDRTARVYSGLDLIKRDNGEKVRWKQQQGGKGDYTLCEECNNNTGAWYANEYIKMANGTVYMLTQNTFKHGEWFIAECNCKILSVIKQIIAMFCSSLHYETVQKLGFDKFLLDKECNKLDKSLFDLRMYIIDYKNGSYHTGKMQLIKKSDDVDMGFYKQTISEIGAYPFGFILNLTPEYPVEYGTSLADLFDTEYDKEYKVQLCLQYLERTEKGLAIPLNFKPINKENN